MVKVRPCPGCGAMLSADSPEDLCPKCLLAEATVEEGPAGPSGVWPGPSPAKGGFTPPDPESLARSLGNLEVLELIGAGGMGAVYKARQPNLDRVVAIKVLPPELCGPDTTFADRFSREARALARLNHPNIVGVYDFGRTDDGLYYFVMEYVEGMTLRHLMRSGEMTPARALAIVPQICEALQYAHDQGVVHRDIKPENILLDKKGNVRLADFGLAKLVGQTTSEPTITLAGGAMGTPHYTAPEQVEGAHDVDHRADIYSLGVVFYEMLTGELPLGHFEVPSKKVQIDVRLDEVVIKTLEKDPERRYQAASEVKTQVDLIVDTPAPAVSVPHAGPASDAQIVKRLTYRTSDALLLKRATRILLVLWLPWAVHVVVEGCGFDWYKRWWRPDIQEWIILGLFSMLVCEGSFWFYLLAKDPTKPRGFGNFFRVLLSCRPLRMLGLKAITVAWMVYLWWGLLFWRVLPMPDRYGIVWHLATVILASFPLILMATAWRVIGRRTRAGELQSSLPDASRTTALTLSAAAQRNVRGPATLLCMTGLVTWLMMVPVSLWVVNALATDVQFLQMETGSFALGTYLVPLLSIWGSGLLLGGVFFVAGLRVMRLKGRRSGVVAGVLAILSTPVNLIGFPAGIWALSSLRDPDMRESFRRQEESPSGGDGRWLTAVILITPLALWAVCVSFATILEYPMGRVPPRTLGGVLIMIVGALAPALPPLMVFCRERFTQASWGMQWLGMIGTPLSLILLISLLAQAGIRTGKTVLDAPWTPTLTITVSREGATYTLMPKPMTPPRSIFLSRRTTSSSGRGYWRGGWSLSKGSKRYEASLGDYPGTLWHWSVPGVNFFEGPRSQSLLVMSGIWEPHGSSEVLGVLEIEVSQNVTLVVRGFEDYFQGFPIDPRRMLFRIHDYDGSGPYKHSEATSWDGTWQDSHVTLTLSPGGLHYIVVGGTLLQPSVLAYEEAVGWHNEAFVRPSPQVVSKLQEFLEQWPDSPKAEFARVLLWQAAQHPERIKDWPDSSEADKARTILKELAPAVQEER